MFLIEYNGVKVLYTGDFNSNADRHLGVIFFSSHNVDHLLKKIK